MPTVMQITIAFLIIPIITMTMLTIIVLNDTYIDTSNTRAANVAYTNNNGNAARFPMLLLFLK